MPLSSAEKPIRVALGNSGDIYEINPVAKKLTLFEMKK
jgi:hypothetical protein